MPNLRVIDLSEEEEREILSIIERHGWEVEFGPYWWFYKWHRTIEELEERVRFTRTEFDWNFRMRSYLEVIKNDASPNLKSKIEEFIIPRDERLLRSTREVDKPLVPEIEFFEKPNWWLFRFPLRYREDYIEDRPMP